MIRNRKMTKLINLQQPRAAAIVLSLLLLGSGALYMKQADAEEGEALSALKDSFLKKSHPDVTNGNKIFLRVAGTDILSTRVVVTFDQDQIENGFSGTLISATVEFEIDATNNNWGSGRTIDIHRLTSAWTETDVTWNSPWVTAGGDFAATATDTVTITNGQTNTVEFNVLADIKAFMSGTPNYGWIIKKTDETSGGGIDFESREAGTPKLVIAFSSPVTTSSGNGCRTWATLNDEAIAELPTNVDYRRCTLIDNEAPKIVRAFMTIGNDLCVETHDNTQTVRVTYNGKEIPRWAGSNAGLFCTDEELPSVIKVVAEDIAGNKSEMVAIDADLIVTTRTEQNFSAILSKGLNPHHGVEGIVLTSEEPGKQVRLGRSVEFSDERSLHVSDKALGVMGEQTIIVTYKGEYTQKTGQIYLFGTNTGLFATFDVTVDQNDVKLTLQKDKSNRGIYDLDLQSMAIFDELNLNSWQKVELDRIFASDKDLTRTQQNILSLVMRHAGSS